MCVAADDLPAKSVCRNSLPVRSAQSENQEKEENREGKEEEEVSNILQNKFGIEDSHRNVTISQKDVSKTLMLQMIFCGFKFNPCYNR